MIGLLAQRQGFPVWEVVNVQRALNPDASCALQRRITLSLGSHSIPGGKAANYEL
jgi:hypothetical protein